MDLNYQTAGLFAVFIEATSELAGGGTDRNQWVLFAPSSREILHGYAGVPVGATTFLKRRLSGGPKKKGAATWQWITKDTAGAERKLKLELDQYVSTGWLFKEPVVVQLAVDDYADVYSAKKTPYKTLRHIEAVTKKRGYRLVNS